jgi:DNA polymerase-3 subunit chi
MAVIRFVGLSQADQKVVMGRLCGHLSKVVAEGRTVVVLTPDAALARWMDERLWDFDEASFVPHSRVEETVPSPLNRVLITHRDRGTWRGDILVNFGPTPLTAEQLAGASQTYEIFRTDTEEGQASGRARWSAYKAAGENPTKESI